MKRLLVVDDERNMRWALRKALEKDNYCIEEASTGQQALDVLRRETIHLVLLDLKMPQIDGLTVLKRIKEAMEDMPVIMLTAHGTMESAVEAMKMGALDYISKPFDIEALKVVIEKALGIGELKRQVHYYREALQENMGKPIIGNSQGLMELMGIINQVSQTTASVLIIGESGTGKELIANEIHYNSPRREKPYIKINCGAIPEPLIESELFGHEKGAFTGAISRKIGRFEQAHGGTLLLDEIGELNLAMQVKLLRVLQEKEFERVGGVQKVQADVRIIAATNRNLNEMIREGTFREDLYYRLNVIPIQVPSLRERKEDIPLLIHHFIDHFSKMTRKGPIKIQREAMEKLIQYPWPGNIRELENVIERMIILSKVPTLTMAQLPREILAQGLREEFVLPEEGIFLEDLEKSLIQQALNRTAFNQTHAAKLLGISRHTLIYRMEKFNLKKN